MRSLTDAIQESVLRLREQHKRNADLLQRSLELNGQTLHFIRRLIGTPEPTYGTLAGATTGPSLLVDGRA